MADAREDSAPSITPQKLRDAASELQKSGMNVLALIAGMELPLTVGDLQYFPRPSQEDRAAIRGVAVLRRRIDDAVAEMYALAAALERLPPGGEVPKVLLFLALPYVNLLKATGSQREGQAPQGQETQQTSEGQQGEQAHREKDGQEKSQGQQGREQGPRSAKRRR